MAGAYGNGPVAPPGQPHHPVERAEDAAQDQGPDQQRPGVRGGGRPDQGGEAYVAEAEATAREQPDTEVEQARPAPHRPRLAARSTRPHPGAG